MTVVGAVVAVVFVGGASEGMDVVGAVVGVVVVFVDDSSVGLAVVGAAEGRAVVGAVVVAMSESASTALSMYEL